MRQVTLAEGGPAEIVSLSSLEADVLSRRSLLEVRPTVDAGWWELSSARRVGVIRVGDLQVTVTPKVSIERLLFLLGYAHSPKGWTSDPVLLDRDQQLLPALAEAFGRQAARALDQGVLQGYRTVEDSLPVLRGRLREREQIQRRFGRMMPLEITFDDFTLDIAENRLLLGAILRLLRVPGVSVPARRRLLRLRMQLSGVTAPVRGAERPRWTPSRLNARYQPALRLAEVVWAGDSFEQRSGTLDVTGFVFDMWQIYEDFVCVALREAFRQYGGRSSLQDHHHLDVGRHIRIRPDFVWYRGGEPAVVADAKYKVERPQGFPDADLYQLLAYCTVLDLPDGHLIYASGSTESRTYQVRGAPVVLHCHTLDLDAPPDGLLRQIDRLTRELLLERTAAMT